MNNKTIKDNPMKTDNELIAEFMGGKFSKGTNMTIGGNNTGRWSFENNEWCYGNQLRYNTSWDWLMPVVEKIAEYRLAYPKETGWVCDCKIVVYKHILYREVVNFIKWYNKNNQ